jgi:hypothetical protein
MATSRRFLYENLSIAGLLLGACAIVIAVMIIVIPRVTPARQPVWHHGDVTYWQRWLGEVCHAAEAKPHVNRFDGRQTIYETQWEADPADDATITSVDCAMTWHDGDRGPRTLVVLLTNTHTALPGYLVTETATAIARELTGDVGGVVMDLAAGPSRAESRRSVTISGGYAQPWMWSMRVVLR